MASPVSSASFCNSSFQRRNRATLTQMRESDALVQVVRAFPDAASYIKSKNLGKVCALITDGRFSGGTSGLSIGHISPEAADGGPIALVEAGDRIRIDI